MLRTLSGIVVVVFLALPAAGQDIVPRFELFGGYSFLDADHGKPRIALNGWGSDFTVNLIGPLGATASFSRQYGARGSFPCYVYWVPPSGHQVFCEPPTTARLQQVLFGPRLSLRPKGTTFFVHTLFGFSSANSGFLWRPRSFAMGVGLGLDVPLSRRLAFRAFQIDYIPIHNGMTQWWQDARLQMGLVVKFGGHSR